MKRILMAASMAVVLGGSVTGCMDGNINTASIGAATDLFKAATLSEKDAKALAMKASDQLDQRNNLLPASHKYSKRLARITQKFQNEDGLKLNFKVYGDKQVNAFAMANGTIRVHSGLMDRFTDDEVRFVIGHEIGHVKLGHSLKAMRTAYATSAVRKGVASQGGVAGALSSSQLGALGEKVINAQFSQSQETASDAYAVKFMKKHGFNPRAGVTSMQKLSKLSKGNHSILSSHPPSTARIEHISSLL